MSDASRPERKSFSKPKNHSSSSQKRSSGQSSRSGKPSSRSDSRGRTSSSNDRSSSGPRNRSSNRPLGRPGSRPTPTGSRFKQELDRPRRAPRIEPEVPVDVEAKMLPGKVRAELLSLSAENAEAVARQMVMIERLLSSRESSDLSLANEFGRAASNRAGRVGVVRNLAGRAALAVKDFAEAKRHLSASLRISGHPFSKVLLAECETGLGRPRKSLELLGDVKAAELSKKENAYAHLISAEAREALGQVDAARVTLSPRIEAFLEATLKVESVDPEIILLAKRWTALKERLGKN